jgi:zinc protease
MAVIVVGDIDVDAMEKKVKDHFESYQNPKNERPHVTYEVPNHKETFVSIESDKESPYAQVQLIYKDYGTPKPVVTIDDFRKYLKEGLFTTMINNRLEELTHMPNPPFTFGYSYHGESWVRPKEAYQSFAMVQEDKQLDALKVLVAENTRVKKFGFTQGELDRAKTEFLAQIESRYNDRDKTESENFVSEYQGHFLTKEPSPGIEWTYDAMKKELPKVTIKDVNGFVNEYIKDDNRVVIFTGPEKAGLKKPTEKEVLDIINDKGDNIAAYNDVAVAKGLLRNEVKPGTVTKKDTNAKLGTTTLTLSNGARVTYKKTDFKNDEVVMEAISMGGSNLYSNEDYKKTQFANGALSEAGFSGLKRNDITKFMTGKIATVNPFIYGVNEGLNGSATPKDMEYMFQMVHAYFTDLNLDKEAFDSYKQKQSAFYKNMASEPSFYFQQEFYTYLNGDNPRFNGFIPTEKTWAETDYALAYQKYKERFANAADFEFYFVGNIDDKAIEEYSKKYIASLPATAAQKEKAKDLGYRMLKGEHKKVVNKGEDPKSTVTIMYYGDTEFSQKENLAMEALGEILTIKLTEELREKESGVYGINARGSLSKVPYGSYRFNIGFPCGPENAEKLTASALREVQKLIEKGPDANDLAKFKEAEYMEYKKNLKENSFWLNSFTTAYSLGIDPENILAKEEKVKALTAKEIQDVAKKYLTKDKIVGMLMPEASNK